MAFILQNRTRHPITIELRSETHPDGTVCIPALGSREVHAILPAFEHHIRAGRLVVKPVPFEVAKPSASAPPSTVLESLTIRPLAEGAPSDKPKRKDKP